MELVSKNVSSLLYGFHIEKRKRFLSRFQIEDQTLLNTTVDSINLRKNYQYTNKIQSEYSCSNSRLEQPNTRFYHLVNVFTLDLIYEINFILF